MKTRSAVWTITLLLMAGCVDAQPVPDARLDLGTVDFRVSAEGDALEAFLTGAGALHSFWYEEARDHFRRARKLDPSFAMAYWGEAMTHDHPLWEDHASHDGRAVLRALDEQAQIRATEREKAYVEAVRRLFDGTGDIDARRQAYADAMADLADRYADDTEAQLFSALAQMSLETFDLADAHDVVPVAAVLETIYKRQPRHPGAVHYLIHVYDSGTFAPLGLRPARDYAEIAPASSHALHMPSHIFRELGMWEDVVASNIEAYQASVDWQKRTNRPLRMRDYHAFLWLFDAYVELDRYDDAERLVAELKELESLAQQRNEDPGRIPNLKGDMQRRLDEAAGRDD